MFRASTLRPGGGKVPSMHWFALAVVFLVVASPAAAGDAVALKEDAAFFTLTNAKITARIEKKSGKLSGLQFAGMELLAGGGGYWSAVGGGRAGTRSEAQVVQNPTANGGERAEVACRLLTDGRDGAPVDVELRYSLGREDSGVYAAAMWHHPAGRRAFSIGEGRFALKLNPRIFDFLNIDADRRRVMPSGADWDLGVPLNLKEARRMTSGVRAGEAEHKYDYSACLFETPAYGWCGTSKGVGVWVVNPSIEYLAGGATKVELTGHLDVNPGGLPVLLNMWHGSHYGGSVLSVREAENWTKVIGPFLIYCNKAENPDVLWKDARRQAEHETAAWPFSWFSHPDFPAREKRGAVCGRIVLNDATSAALKNLRVGLAAPDYRVDRGRRGSTTVDWQLDSRHYQFWTRAAEDGSFSIPNVRPGEYTLHAIAENVLGEFAMTSMKVTAGGKLDLGTPLWSPVRHGRQLWEIGVPDRTAREFRHGDHFWQWGLYHKYPAEFPNDVNFLIGSSNSRRDWNYAHLPRLENSGARPCTWKISFDLAAAPPPGSKATLRIGVAGSRCPAGIGISVNAHPTTGLSSLPDTGVMHRDGITGYWCERSVPIDGAWLKQGANVITLTNRGRNWTEGILYDYLRLELEEAKP